MFADEIISIYVILRTPYQDEIRLKHHISRLVIVLDAHAISSTSPAILSANAHYGASTSQNRDIIWSGKVDTLDDPIIVVEESVEDKGGRDVLVIWGLAASLREYTKAIST